MDIIINELRKLDYPNDPPGYLRVYLSVTATDGVRSITEEFHIGRQVIGRQIVTNALGWFKTISGSFIDPTTLDPSKPEPKWAYEVATQDFKAEILAVCKVAFDNLFSGRRKEDRRDALKAVVQARFGSNLQLPIEVTSLIGQKVTI